MNSAQNIGQCRFIHELNRLERDGKEVSLQTKPADCLNILIANKGKLVSREEIYTALWGNQHVTDASMSRVISLVRKAFSQLGDDSVAIEVVFNRGYKLAETSAQTETAQLTTLKKLSKIPDSKSIEERMELAVNDDFINALGKKFSLSHVIGIFAAAIVLTVAIFSSDFSSTVTSPTQILEKDITYATGVEDYMSFSPSGNYLAFVQRDTYFGKRRLVISETKETARQQVVFRDFPIHGSVQWIDEFHLAIAVTAEDDKCEIIKITTAGEVKDSLYRCMSDNQDLRFDILNNESLIVADGDPGLYEALLVNYRKNTTTLLPNLNWKNGTGPYSISVSRKHGKVALLNFAGRANTEIIIFDSESQKSKVVYKTSSIIREVVWDEENIVFYEPLSKSFMTLDLSKMKATRFLEAPTATGYLAMFEELFAYTYDRNFTSEVSLVDTNFVKQRTLLRTGELVINPKVVNDILYFVSKKSGFNQLYNITQSEVPITSYSEDTVLLDYLIFDQIAFIATNNGIDAWLNGSSSSLTQQSAKKIIDYSDLHGLRYLSFESLNDDFSIRSLDNEGNDVKLVQSASSAFSYKGVLAYTKRNTKGIYFYVNNRTYLAVENYGGLFQKIVGMDDTYVYLVDNEFGNLISINIETGDSIIYEPEFREQRPYQVIGDLILTNTIKAGPTKLALYARP